MLKVALKVVERPAFHQEEVELWSPDSDQGHSLHKLGTYPGTFPAELPAYFIARYTKRGDAVLDPFCGSGTTTLEAALAGRVPVGADINPVAVALSRARLFPADITEVTLWLQMLNLSRPVGLDMYRGVFSPFYDIDTFREILNLKVSTGPRPERVAAFVQAVMLAILHGHTAGFLSVYSFPQMSLSPEKQTELNNRRHLSPDYRAVIPRILRKTAMVERDGIPSILLQMAKQGYIGRGDARNLANIPSGSISLVVTAPPLPGDPRVVKESWLRLWYLGEDVPALAEREAIFSNLSSWLDFMNEFLIEMARVVSPGGRVVLDLKHFLCGGNTVESDIEVTNLVEESLSRFFDAEVLMVQKTPQARLKHSLRDRSDERERGSHRMLVLRRK